MGRLLAFDRAASPHGRKLWTFAEGAARLNILTRGSSLAKSKKTREWDLCFFNGEGVNRSLVFEVFAFEVCADPFAGFCAGRGEKINLFEPRAGTLACPYCQDLLYLFKIVCVVGGDF